MRTVPAVAVIALATSVGHLVSSNYIIDLAAANHYNYDDYVLLCKCLNRAPLAEAKLSTQVHEHHQLSLEGIV